MVLRPRRRGQAPKPHRGAPKAQGLTAAIAVAAPSPVQSIAQFNSRFEATHHTMPVALWRIRSRL